MLVLEGGKMIKACQGQIYCPGQSPGMTNGEVNLGQQLRFPGLWTSTEAKKSSKTTFLRNHSAFEISPRMQHAQTKALISGSNGSWMVMVHPCGTPLTCPKMMSPAETTCLPSGTMVHHSWIAPRKDQPWDFAP